MSEVELVPRSDWTGSSRGGAQLTGTKLVGIAWHWPGTSQDVIGVETKAQVANRLRGYRNFHVGTRGWSDIGYNHAIDQAGRIWDLRGLGRVGAHCASPANPDANHEWMGVLLVLGDRERPSAKMIAAAQFFMHRVFLPRWPNRTRDTGHGRAPGVPGARTSCPGPFAAELIVDGVLIKKPESTGGTMSWNEDLTPGTPGNDITNLAHKTLPDTYGRDAADLLGYAAAGGSVILRAKELVKRVFRTDGVLRAPSTRPNNDTNTHLYAETFLREIWDMAYALRTMPDELEALRASILGGSADEIKALIETKHAEAEQQRQAIADTLTSKLDSIAEATQGSDPAEAKLAAILEILGFESTD